MTALGDYAFCGCTSLARVSFGRNCPLKTIGNHGFCECGELSDFTLPAGLTELGENMTFYACVKLQRIHIPDGVTRISNATFKNCSGLMQVSFGQDSRLTCMDYEAFYKCSKLSSIEIPKGVNKIGRGAFFGCNNLAAVYYGGESEADWNAIVVAVTGNEFFLSVPRYGYSETEPAVNAEGTAYDGNYWYRDSDGNPVAWVYTSVV